jgi:hypothetical protein
MYEVLHCEANIYIYIYIYIYVMNEKTKAQNRYIYVKPLLPKMLTKFEISII